MTALRARQVVAMALALLALECERTHVHSVTRDTPIDSLETLTTAESGSLPSGAVSEVQTVVTAPSLDGSSSHLIGSTSGDRSSGRDAGETNECASIEAAAGDTSITIAVGSLERSYVLHIPPSFDAARAAPLVIDFHGAGGSGWDELRTSPYPPVTDLEGVIVAFPDGVNGPIGTAWNVGPCCVPGVDDLAFVDALLADVKTRVCVDARRVYAVGVLTGGGMAHYLACERSAVFAAVSPAAFDLARETVDDCQPSDPVGVVAFRGTADERVPYDGGSSMLVPSMPVTFLGAQASSAKWAALNGCSGEPSVPDASGCTTYVGCHRGVEVVLCSKENGPAEHGDASIAWPIMARHVR